MTGTSHQLFLWALQPNMLCNVSRPMRQSFFLFFLHPCVPDLLTVHNSSCCSFLLLAKWTKQFSVLPAIAFGNGRNHYTAWHYISLVRLYNESLWHSLHYFAPALLSCYGVRRWKDLFCQGLGNRCFTSIVPFSYTSSPRWFLIYNILQPLFYFSPSFCLMFLWFACLTPNAAALSDWLSNKVKPGRLHLYASFSPTFLLQLWSRDTKTYLVLKWDVLGISHEIPWACTLFFVFFLLMFLQPFSGPLLQGHEKLVSQRWSNFSPSFSFHHSMSV